MREDCIFHHCKRSIRAAMLRVTMTACETWIVMHQPAVQGCHVLQLYCNICMADHTAISHSRGFPGPSVTGCAVSADLCMRPDAAKHVSALSIQRTRVIEQSLACVRIARNHKHSDQRCKDTCSR